MNLENFKNELRKIKLTPEEKAAIFNNVMNFPTPSPYVFTGIWKRVVFSRISISAAIFTLIVIGGSGGISYAARSSVPGDKLYAIKIKMIEPVVGAFMFSPTSRAKWEADKAVRRLQEAEELTKKNDLTEEHRQEIEKNFNQSVERFKAAAKENKEEDKDEIEEIKTNLGSSLNDQVDRLGKERKEENEEDNQEKEIKRLQDAVHEKVKKNLVLPEGIEPPIRP